MVLVKVHMLHVSFYPYKTLPGSFGVVRSERPEDRKSWKILAISK